MKKIIFNKKFIIFIIFFVFPTNLSAINISTINIAYILEKSISYNNFLIELDKKKIRITEYTRVKRTRSYKVKTGN